MLTRYEPTADRPWNVERVVHLHRRAGFAAAWDQIQRDLKDGPEIAVTRVLHANGAGEFEQMSSVIAEAAVGSGDINRLKAWWLYRMLSTPDPLGERLTLLWHNHFATSNEKVADIGLMHGQNSTLRQFARGPFGGLLRRMANDPALLIWLDADANRKEHPNENFAREIMELFTLGAGAFSENDVKEAARALTGWSVNRGKFRFDADNHDGGEKAIFGQRGTWTGDDFVKMLQGHEATAQRLTHRIGELFFGETANAEAVLGELAIGLRERDLDIGWAVETVLRSEAFFATGNIGNRVLSPVEFAIGAIKALEITDPPPSTLLLAEATARLGQDLFAPPNVFGWPSGRGWLTSRAVIGRANFAAALVAGRLHSPPKPFDAARLADLHGFKTPDEIGSFFAALLLGEPKLPSALEQHIETPNKLVIAMLSSPEGQLA